MLVKELNEVEASLKRIKEVSKVLSLVFKLAILLFIAFFVFSILVIFINDQADLVSAIVSVTPLLLYVLATVILFVIMHGVFDDIAKGRTPFTNTQVRRFIWAALILFLGAVVEMVSSTGVLPIAQTDNLIVNYYDSSTGSNTPSINLASLLGAALLYALSFVFKYGALLQEFTDDTL